MTASAQFDAPVVHGRKRVLSSGHNSALLRLRNSFIETAGYQVVTTKESALLLDLATKQDFDAVVLCSSIPARTQENIARDLKKVKPNLPLVIICAADDQHRFAGLAQAVVVAEDGVSQPLMEAIFSLAGDPDE